MTRWHSMMDQGFQTEWPGDIHPHDNLGVDATVFNSKLVSYRPWAVPLYCSQLHLSFRVSIDWSSCYSLYDTIITTSSPKSFCTGGFCNWPLLDSHSMSLVLKVWNSLLWQPSIAIPKPRTSNLLESRSHMCAYRRDSLRNTFTSTKSLMSCFQVMKQDEHLRRVITVRNSRVIQFYPVHESPKP